MALPTHGLYKSLHPNSSWSFELILTFQFLTIQRSIDAWAEWKSAWIPIAASPGPLPSRPFQPAAIRSRLAGCGASYAGSVKRSWGVSVPSPPWQGLICFLALSSEVSDVERSVAVGDYLLEATSPPTSRVYFLRNTLQDARLPAALPRVEGLCSGCWFPTSYLVFE